MKNYILLVDDDRVNMTYLKFGLKQKGYEVDSACDGQDALKKVEQKLPDLIVLDVQMPNMTGFEFMTELKVRGQGSEVPVIMLTANENMQDMFMAEGVKGYFVKPVNLDDLDAKIKEVFAE